METRRATNILLLLIFLAIITGAGYYFFFKDAVNPVMYERESLDPVVEKVLDESSEPERAVSFERFESESGWAFLYPTGWIVTENLYATPAMQAAGEDGDPVGWTITPSPISDIEGTIVMGGRQATCQALVTIPLETSLGYCDLGEGEGYWIQEGMTIADLPNGGNGFPMRATGDPEVMEAFLVLVQSL